MDKALYYVSLARKAGLVELGEEPVGAAARGQHAKLVIVAADASEHTWRRAQSFVAHTQQQCVRTPFSKDELGQAVGRGTLALAAFTDAPLALAFVKALDQPAQHETVLAALDARTKREQQRRQEEKQHQRNRTRRKKS